MSDCGRSAGFSRPADDRYFEDYVAGSVHELGAVDVSAADIVAFARQFDPQPFHLDEAAAKGTLFGSLAASGWHTAAMTMKLVVESVPFASGIIGSGGELSWPRPTYPGDRLRAVSEVLAVTPSKSKPDRGMVEMRLTTLNQKDEPVQIFQPKIVVMRRG